MEKKNAKAKEIILTVIFFPIVVLFMLGLLIITPFDYLKYKNVMFYLVDNLVFYDKIKNIFQNTCME